MDYPSCVKDGQTSWNKVASIQFNKCISNGIVDRNELPERTFVSFQLLQKYTGIHTICLSEHTVLKVLTSLLVL